MRFETTRRLLRALPDGMPGKTRAARMALRWLALDSAARLPDRFGNTLSLPSLHEPMAVALFAFGCYEPDTLDAVLAHLTPGGVYLDVGANIGALALPVAAKRPDARIICIEADPDIAALLRCNAAENDRSNITVFECVAGREARSAVAFYRAPRHKFGMGSVGPQFSEPPITLKQYALDDVLDELAITNVDVIKLDIEGAEFEALQGLRRRLESRTAPTLVLEFVDWAETRVSTQAAGDAQRFLLSIGYHLFRLGRRGTAGAIVERPLTYGSAMILAMRSPLRRELP